MKHLSKKLLIESNSRELKLVDVAKATTTGIWFENIY